MRNGLQSFLSLPLISRKKIEPINIEAITEKENVLLIEKEPEKEQIKIKKPFVLPENLKTDYEYTGWFFLTDVNLRIEQLSSVKSGINVFGHPIEIKNVELSLNYYNNPRRLICEHLEISNRTKHVITFDDNKNDENVFIMYVNETEGYMLFVLYNTNKNMAQQIIKFDYSKQTTLNKIKDRQDIIDPLLKSILSDLSVVYNNQDDTALNDIVKKIHESLGVKSFISL